MIDAVNSSQIRAIRSFGVEEFGLARAIPIPVAARKSTLTVQFIAQVGYWRDKICYRVGVSVSAVSNAVR